MNNNLVESNSDINTLLDVDSLREDVDIDDLIYEGYKHLDYIVKHEDEKLIELRKIIVLLNRIIEYFKNSSISSNNSINKLLVDSKNRIESLINEDTSAEKIASVLDSMFIQIRNAVNDAKNKEVIDDRDSVFGLFVGLDKLYSSLYDAIDNNDLKKVTYYRGNIISSLKLKMGLIDEHYHMIKPLIEIKTLKDNNQSFDTIINYLKTCKDNKYVDELKEHISNSFEFNKVFDEIYKRLMVDKTVLYRSALNHEIKDQREDLKRRYSDEFLEYHPPTVGEVAGSFPSALGLTIKDISNSIVGLSEARNLRMALSKTGNILSGAGKLLLTPPIFLGKFIVTGLYQLYYMMRDYLYYKFILSKKRRMKKLELEKKAKEYNDYMDQINAEEMAQRERAVNDYCRLHPELSRKQIERIVDETSVSIDYLTQATRYEDILIKDQLQKDEDMDILLGNGLSNDDATMIRNFARDTSGLTR